MSAPAVYSLGDLALRRDYSGNARGGWGADTGGISMKSYQILISDPHSGLGYDLTPVCTSLQWDYDLDQACEKITATFVKVTGMATILKPLNQLIIKAIKITALGIGTELENLKFGVIIDTELADQARGTLTVTAYDIMWYLANNKASISLQAETASDFIKRVAPMYGIPLDRVDETYVQLLPNPLIERTLWDMFVSVLSLTRDIAYSQKILSAGSDPATENPIAPEDKGDRYYMRVNFDKVMVIRKQDPLYTWKFELGNIFNASSKWSAANYRNVVRVYKRQQFDSSLSSVADVVVTDDYGDPSNWAQYPEDTTNDPDIKKYGMLAEAVSLAGAPDAALQEPDNTAQAAYQARELYVRLHRVLQTATITTININTLGPGDMVFVAEPITGLNSKFYVKSGQHKVTAQASVMTLSLNALDMLPEAYKTKAESTTALIGGPAL